MRFTNLYRGADVVDEHADAAVVDVIPDPRLRDVEQVTFRRRAGEPDHRHRQRGARDGQEFASTHPTLLAWRTFYNRNREPRTKAFRRYTDPCTSAHTPSALAAAALLLSSSPALAQRFTFERTLTTGANPQLDISTNRGRIAVSAGDAGHVTIKGTVTVRVGMDVPTNAVELARQYAGSPEVEQKGDIVRLRPPSDANAARAVTVSYDIVVPPGTAVTSASDSGATTISGVNGRVSVTTSSASIALDRLGAETVVKTGSGAVSIAGVGGTLDVNTQSGGLDLRGLRGALRARTQSGNVEATFVAAADVDVETGSSAITLSGVDGALEARTQSGRVDVHGKPARPWTITTGSSAIELSIPAATSFTLEATSHSGSVDTEGFRVDGSTEKRHVAGKIGSGGPLVTLDTRSGSIKLRAAGR